MRALITGAEGFAGGHLVQCLQAQEPELALFGTTRFDPAQSPHLLGCMSDLVQIDLCDPAAVKALLDAVRPDYIYHLAAQAFVPRSFEDPWETLENNIRSQLNLLQGCVDLKMAPRFLVVSSAEIYGAVPPDQMPITEDYPLLPTNPYSVSKVGQDMLGLQYSLSYQLPIIRVRPFNHIGPGQSLGFVAPAFAVQIARIEQGLQEPVISVGDLSPKRDFTDVRDVVRAYHAALSKGSPGAVYNVCSGRAYSVRYLLDVLLSYSTTAVEVRTDPARLRVTDRPVVLGSAARLEADTGWYAAIPFEQSLRDVLEECRARVLRQSE